MWAMYTKAKKDLPAASSLRTVLQLVGAVNIQNILEYDLVMNLKRYLMRGCWKAGEEKIKKKVSAEVVAYQDGEN